MSGQERTQTVIVTMGSIVDSIERSIKVYLKVRLRAKNNDIERKNIIMFSKIIL